MNFLNKQATQIGGGMPKMKGGNVGDQTTVQLTETADGFTAKIVKREDGAEKKKAVTGQGEGVTGQGEGEEEEDPSSGGRKGGRRKKARKSAKKGAKKSAKRKSAKRKSVKRKGRK